MEAWSDNVPAGKQTDFRRSVALRDGEIVVLGWILWPDWETADRCEAAMRTNARFRDLVMPFDGSRTIFGGFATVFEASREAKAQETSAVWTESDLVQSGVRFCDRPNRPNTTEMGAKPNVRFCAR
jgi:hypothetical protein